MKRCQSRSPDILSAQIEEWGKQIVLRVPTLKKDMFENHPLWFIRKYKKGDESDIVDLFKYVAFFCSVKEWRWKFRDNPYGHFTYVGEHNGRIVGHLAHVPALMKIGDRTGIGCQVTDVVVHPKFRHQGMFLALSKAQFSEADKIGINVVYGFPNRVSGYLKAAGSRKHIACKVPVLIKFTNMNEPPFSLYKHTEFFSIPRVMRNVLGILFKIFLTINSLYSKIFCQTKGDDCLENVKIRPIRSFDYRINAFWETASRYYDIIVVRNRRYLNWRYFEKPNAKYMVLLGERNDKILGYIVLLCRSEKNLKIGYIVDILASSKSVIKSLVLKAIEYFEREKTNLIRCLMLKNSVYYKILRSYNFIPIGSTFFLAILTRGHLSIPETFIKDHTKWYITLGDTDRV